MPERPGSDGYHRLAALMAGYPSSAITRRFMTLNAYSLLSLQAELAHLEDELREVVVRDRKNPETALFEFNIHTAKDAAEDYQKGLHWRTVLEIRKLLGDYHEACVRFQQLAAASPANQSDLDHLRYWLEHKDGGHLFLKGVEKHPWAKDALEADLTSLTSRDKDKDALSKWIDRRVIPFYHEKLGHRYNDPISLAESLGAPQPLHYYPDSYISTSINAFSTILSSLLPTMSIFALYFIHSPLARIGAIIAFTFLFSAVLTLVAKAKRIDCFAATTAFAAVQVVFVSVGPQ